MVQWNESFWGEGNRGFELLYNNVKLGAIAIDEFQKFLTEISQCESTYSKALSRLQSQLVKTQQVGTYTPIWNLIRDLVEKISSAHLSSTNFYQELLREIHTYQEVFQRKVKSHIQKDSDIQRTADLITQLNHSWMIVSKAKDQFHFLTLDYERAKRSTSNSTTNPNGSQETNSSSKQLERLEKKLRQAQDEYKTTIEKYNVVRNDYEKRFSDACSKFQGFEIDHIEKMLAFSLHYSQIQQRVYDQIESAQNEFTQTLKSFTGQDLLDTFVEQKKTGVDRPLSLQFEEVENSNLNDLSTGPSEDFNLSDQFDSISPTPKIGETNRALSPISSVNHRHSPVANNSSIGPSSTAAAMNNLNLIAARASEPSVPTEQSTNPFKFNVRKNKFPGIFGTTNKEKKVKKKNGKLSSRLRSEKKTSPLPSNGSTKHFDQNEDCNQSSLINLQNKSPLSKTYDQSSSSLPPIFNDDDEQQNLDLLPSSKLSKSSSSSETTDDDDDNLTTKINFKINSIAPPISDLPLTEEDQQAKIMSAMRLVDQNLGHIPGNSRRLASTISLAYPSLANDPFVTRTPPQPPPRPPRIVPVSPSTDSFDLASAFPPTTEFEENLAIRQRSLTPSPQSKNTASASSAEDDPEVANSFPSHHSPQKTFQSPFSQISSPNQLMLRTSSSVSASPIYISSHGASPLTLGVVEQIPLAIAFNETIHVMIDGKNRENWTSRVTGEMLMSFPAVIFTVMADPSRSLNRLEFRLQNLDQIQNITLKSSCVTQNDDETIFGFEMSELNQCLRHLQEKTPGSSFFNLSVLNYEMKPKDTLYIPIDLSSQWTRTFDSISVTINYRFDSLVIPEKIRFNNDAVVIYTIISDGEQVQKSSPTAGWSVHDHKLWWKVPYVVDGSGILSATISAIETDQDQPLTTSSTVNLSFLGENGLFTSVDFDLISTGYRVSLMKKKILTGRYQSEHDQSEPLHLFQRPSISSPATS